MLHSSAFNTDLRSSDQLSDVKSSQARKAALISEDGLDPREVDKLLNEIASIAGRWNLFRQFLVDRLSVRAYICIIPKKTEPIFSLIPEAALKDQFITITKILAMSPSLTTSPNLNAWTRMLR